MLNLSPDQLLPLILGACLLLVVSINVYTLLHLLFRIDAGRRGTRAPDAEADAAWLNGMNNLFNLVDPVGLSEAGAGMDQSMELLEALGEIRNEDLFTWREAQLQRIGSLLADHRQQRQKLLQMHDALAQARATITTLRSQPPRSAIIAAQLTSLKALNARQEEATCELTSDRTQYQWELRTAEQQSRLATESASRQALEHINAQLLREIEALRDWTRTLEKANADLRATHAHVVQEKLFIEEAFVKLDGYPSTLVRATPTDNVVPLSIGKETT